MDELTRILFENTDDALLLLDADGCLLDANENACQLYGYAREELLGQVITSLVSSEATQSLMEILNQLPASNGTMGPLVACRRDGATFAVDLHVIRLPANGQGILLARIRPSSSDPTPETPLHARLEETVREIQALYRATSCLLRTDNLQELTEQIVDVLHKELGFPNCDIELLDQSTGRLINYGYRGQYKKLPLRVDGPGLVALAVRTGQVVNVPDVEGHPDYLAALPETRSELVMPLEVEGEIIGTINLESPELAAFSARDVRVLQSFANRAALAIRQAQLHEQLRAQTREVQYQQEQYQNLFDHLRDIVYTHGLDGRIQTINPAVTPLLGYAPEEVLGKPVTEFIAPRYREQFEQYIEEIKQTGHARGLLTLVGRDGQERVFEYNNTLVVEDGATIGSRGIIHDVTERIKLEQQLRRRADREMLINRIGHRLHHSLEVEETLHQAVQELGAYLDVDKCLYYQIDAASGQVLLLHEYRKEGMPAAIPIYQMGEVGDLADLARQGMPLVFDDVMTDPRTQPVYESLLAPRGVRAMLCIPLLNEGDLEGVLGLIMTQDPRQWREDEIEISTVVATQMSVALRQARLYQRLRQSEEKYRSIIENAQEGIFQTTPGGRFLTANLTLARMLGYESPDELLGLDLAPDLWVESAAREVYKHQLENQGELTNFEMDLKKRDGSRIIVQENSRVVRDAQGQVLYYEGTLQDVTRQKQAERELHQRNRELSTLYTIAMAISRDPSVSSVLHNTLYELTRVLNLPYGCVYIIQDQTLVLRSYRGFSRRETEPIQEFDLTRHPWMAEIKLVREPLDEASGEIEPWEKERGIQAWISVPIRSKNELIGAIRLASYDLDHFTITNISLISGVANQIAIALENARLYEQMKESEHKYRSIFEDVVVGLYQSSPEGKVLTANPALIQMLGYDSLEDLLAADILNDMYVDPEDREKNMEVLRRTGRIEGVEYRLRRKDGQEITVLEHARAIRDPQGRVLYYEGTLSDITEKKALERQLLQAQKMESIGTLAGGIAHDFNNLLTGILGYTSLILSQTRPSDRHYQHLLIIEQSARHAAELTEQLLTFSRQTMTQLRSTNLNAVLDETMMLLRGSLDASIEIEVRKEPAIWTIQANARQIQQVLMNLCVNARDAMPDGGLLKIKTANVSLSEADTRGLGGAQPGRFVLLRVSDTGEGISPENLPRVFDPFFSTKEVNKGTGLGLSMAYGIIKGHDGFIQVESQVNVGTEFSIYLPVAAKLAPAETAEPAGVGPNGATILIVDDEEIVRQLARAILEREGYGVITAASGHEALQIYHQRGEEISLVVLDLTMPKMSGHACYEELRKLDPGIKVLLSSGYSADEAIQDLLDQGAIRFMQKPYRVEDLTRVVREMLDRKE